ncbi:MAG: DNA helicase UvrD [Myxococcales bacterium]|nr:DNA helicase UvrD [Myxococcales bacterium]
MRSTDLSLLNSPQREAVLHGEGPLLVLAGAGSGKTRVITTRVARLVEDGVPPRAICALSFTNKAAEEMRARVGRLVGEKVAAALTMSTFHALGLRILEAERAAFGFARGFTIYDTSDQLGLIREVLRSVKLDDRRFDPKAILHRISRAKNAFLAPGEPFGHPDDEYDEITRAVYPRYEEALRAFAAVDFDDLIVAPVRLLDRDERARDRWEGRFGWLLVDEYQDTNRAQLMLVRRLAARHANVTVVGDDDQSIYAWRGAEASNILDFERHFPGAKVIKLEQNYRSTPTILAAANAVIRNNVARRDKTLFAVGAPGAKLVSVTCEDADEEARFVVSELERLRRDERLRYQDLAVLYRSNIQARAFEEALHSANVPFDLVGGQEFYERKEIKDVISYLKLALNPRDEISLRRVVNYPARGIGPVTLERAAAAAPTLYAGLRALAVQAGAAPTLFDDLDAPGEGDGDGGGTAAVGAAALGVAIGLAGRRGPDAKAVREFVALIERTRAGLVAGRKAAEVTAELVAAIGLYDDLRAASPSAAAAKRRIDNVEDFVRALDAHEARHPGRAALARYLQLLTLRTNDDDEQEGGDKITLTTLHGAKGLEWPVVFLVGLEEELLPHARTLYPQGPDIAGDADVSEERRLAYVGITRARERLYVTRALTRKKHGKERPRVPSRFLLEIPAELCESRDLIAEAKAPVGADEMQAFFQSFLARSAAAAPATPTAAPPASRPPRP